MRLPLILALLGACQDSDVSRALGARCDLSAECEDRCLEPSLEWPGGFCTLTCDTDADCPRDAACVDESTSGVCAFTCTTIDQCTFLGAGYDCKERDAHEVGAPPVKVCRG